MRRTMPTSVPHRVAVVSFQMHVSSSSISQSATTPWPKYSGSAARKLLPVTYRLARASFQPRKQDGYTSSTDTRIQKSTFLPSLTRASVAYSAAGATARVCSVGHGVHVTLRETLRVTVTKSLLLHRSNPCYTSIRTWTARKSVKISFSLILLTLLSWPIKRR